MVINITKIREKCTKGKLIFSICIAVFLVIADYWVQNSTFPLFDDVSLLAWVDQFKESNKKYFNEDDVTYINLGKDKALVPVYNEWGDKVGNSVITDREVLLRFLLLAEKSNYKYIFIDVRFEKGYDTPFDSALFSQIKKMPNVVIATHRAVNGYEIADSTLLPKTAFADYRGTVFSSFSRYEFIQEGQSSVALRMLNDLDSIGIKKHWYGYTVDNRSWKLCYNLGFIPLPSYLYESKDTIMMENTESCEIRYPYLGSFFFSNPMFSEDEIIRNKLDNKIIVLGDFDNDKHTTYIGEVPGSVISLAAYKYLQNGKHEVSGLYVLILLVFYWLIAIIMLTVEEVGNLFKDGSFGQFVLTLLGLGFVFFVSKILCYMIASISMVVTIPTVVFQLIGYRDTFRRFGQFVARLFKKKRLEELN